MKTYLLKIIMTSLLFNTALASDILRLDGGRKVSSSSHLGLSVFSLGFHNNTCTGTLISKYGHILTARHCLEPTIYRTQYLNSDIEFFKTEYPTSGLSITHNNIENLKSHLIFSFGLDSQYTEGTIVAIGPGQLYPRFSTKLEGIKKDQHQSFTQQGYSVGADFAIVHIPQLSNQSCYKLKNEVPNIEDEVHSISFPCHNVETKDWPQLYTSHVLRYAEGDDSVDFKGSILPNGNFITDSLGEHCNSGSSILNEKNEIIGIMHTAYDYIAENKKQIHLINLSIPRMLEFIDSETKTHILKLNQECDLSLP